MIKKQFIEQDEFDVGIRNILNYGHCFGHAIESSSNYEIPHGISVSLGMDIANYVSLKLGHIDENQYLKFKDQLTQNYSNYVNFSYDVDNIIRYIKSDKKHTDKFINLIMPITNTIEKVSIENTEASWETIKQILTNFMREIKYESL